MADPLVSVTMITYNHAPFIVQAIEGVLQQKTNFPFELVIGEDCSTDGTREIVFKYQKKYPDIIRMITSDNNVGMTNNGIRTMKACRGKYLAFCEGDDYWQSLHKLQKQADYLESHPECGMVYSSYDVYHVGSRKRICDFIKYKKWTMPKHASISDIIENNGGISFGILTCTIMVRRNLCEQIIESDPYLHQSGYFQMGDIQLWAEISTIAQVHYIPESLATHIITNESASRSKDIIKVLQFSLSCSELGLYLCNKYNLSSSKRKNQEEWCNCSLRLAFHTRSQKLADEVRRKKQSFSCREWLLYYGAKNLAFHYPLRIATLFLKLFSKKHRVWQ
jgi:glycosyltransferase involved in cell wall biosynthesis